MDDERAKVAAAEPELTKLHPDHIKVLRIESALVGAGATIAAAVANIALPVPPGVIVLPVLLAAALWVWRIPFRRYLRKGYDMGADRLRVVRGFLWRSDTVVPFGRVQHIDVTQGPLERWYGLSTLVLHTAGTHNSSVPLPGLKRETAEELRETIRQHIKRESL